MAETTVCPSCGARQTGTNACTVCGYDFSSQAAVPQNAAPAPEEHRPVAAVKGSGKFCPSCGTHVEPGDRFCGNCGTPLVKGATPKGPAQPQQKFQPKTMLVAAGVIVVIVAGIVLLTRALRDKTPDVTPAQQTENADQPPAQQHATSPEQLKAIEQFKKMVADNPGDTLALMHLANSLYDAENFTEAVPYYVKYLAINPKNVGVRVDYAYSLFRTGNNDKALDELKAALKVNPKHQTAMFNMAVIYLTMGQMEDGATWLDKCITVDSTTQVGQEAKNLLANHAQWFNKSDNK